MKEIDSLQVEELKKRHHEDMVKAGWADPSISDPHYMALIISEIGEAIHAKQLNRMYNGKISRSIIISRAQHLMQRRKILSFSSRVPKPEDVVDDLMLKVENEDDFKFMVSFEFYVKDTFQDELADVLLRCLNLMAIRNAEFSSFPSFERIAGKLVRMKKFTEMSYDLMSILTWRDEQIPKRLRLAIVYLFAMAERFDIDLLQHAELKRQYNQLRTDWNLKKFN